MGRTRLNGRLARGFARTAAAGAVAATAHTLVNLRWLRIPPRDPAITAERVSVLLPVRNEAARVGACLTALLAQEGVPDLEILVLDDDSDDNTAAVVRALAGADRRVRLLTGRPLTGGWLGKPHACAQLADAATGTVLVFVDADVVLEPDAVTRTVALLRESSLDLVCPYPRQVAETAGERLVQPLLQWSWLTFLPLRLAENSPSPSMAAANGQLLACDSSAYVRVGGHAAVRDAVLEDLALARTFKAGGRRAGMADGTTLATCRMYESWNELEAGYTKSLWSAFGSPGGAAGVLILLSALYVVPPVAAVLGRAGVRRAGLVGTAAGLTGRVVVARRVGGRVWPDSAAHPVSVVLLGWLTARSVARHRRGELTWKGRSL